MKINKTLTTLILSANTIGNNTGVSIGNMLKVNSTLSKIDICNELIMMYK